MKRVLIGLLGTKLDSGNDSSRWQQWRPTVSLFQHEDLLWDRLELIAEPKYGEISRQVLADIQLVSPETRLQLNEFQFGKDPWDLEKVYSALHSWAKDYPFDPVHEEYFIHISTGTHIAQISLFLLNEAGTLPGKLIQSLPPTASKSRNPPQPSYSFIDLDLSKYDQLNTRFRPEPQEVTDFLKSGIATRNHGFNQLIERIETVALSSQAPILLTGPTGAGKSLLARRIYELRQQRGGLKGSFVEINCATLTGDTAASALFGHTKGAFTGAQRDRPGLLREADGGLLFLDEIGELGKDEQAMLLRALEDKSFLPVGADKPVSSQFQLIAGTNRDLREAVRLGHFREDLLARIHLWTFELPSLAKRREDIAPNLEYELEKFRTQYGQLVDFNKEAKLEFLKFAESPSSPWSGNFRDLNAAVTRMATLAPKGRIRVEDVQEEIQRLKATWPSQNQADCSPLSSLESFIPIETLAELDPFDLVQLRYVIEICQQSKSLSDAGRELFSASRHKKRLVNDADRLRKYLAKFGLRFEQLRP